MPTALVVEDNKLNQLVTVGALQAAGYDAHVVDDGAAAAIAACERGSFDVVLMDVMMPTMSGYEAVRCLRALESATGSRRVPVIGVSARAMPGDWQMALAAGFDDYVSKPLRREVLYAALDRWVGSLAVSA